MKGLISRYKEIIVIVLVMIFGSYLFSYLSYESLLNRPSPSLLDLWNKWDSPSYLDIAKNGYRKFGDEMWVRIVFFPLYPFFIRLFALVLKNYKLSALVVSNLAYVIACFYLYRLVLRSYTEEAAVRSVFYMSVFPTAYFFHAGYTEGLFLALTIASFYYAREDRWLLAGFLGMLASATRITGIFLVLALLIEYLSQKEFRIKKLKLNFLYLGLIPIGFIAYLVINYITFENAFAFLIAQKEYWNKNLASPWRGLLWAWNYLWWKEGDPAYRLTVGGVEFVFGIFGLLCTIWAFLRLRVSYGVYMLLTWIAATSTSFLLSVPRYTLSMFPIFILLALGAERREIHYLITIVFLFLYSLFLIMFAQGLWAF
ncbi:MAG TPA: glycosyltransferase family 39 protein [Thermodesulfobacteriota bacterium]|nr:glycosyltransferase family 39 protein [Thermodesulfobacteriota bacterium]